jgi:hypothetical protein
LKLDFAPARTKKLNRRGWELTVREARHQIRKLLGESPSLRGKIGQLFADAYESGRNAALIALKLPEKLQNDSLPATSAWNLDQVLDEDFFSKAQ